MKTSILLLAFTAGLLGNSAQAYDFNDFLKQLPSQLGKQPEPAQPAPAQTDAPAKQPSLRENATNILLGAIAKPTDNDEIQLGQQLAGNLLGAAPLVKDDNLQRYVNKVGRWVALQSDRPNLPWHFGVIDSTDINAFAAPGGFVFVTKGLYQQLNNEAELAGVLGHEISHVVNKDQLNILQKSKLIGLGAQALGKQIKGSDAAQQLIGSGAEIMSRALDKDAEFAADRMGVVLAARAGYDAYGLPAVLQQIGHAAPNDSRVALLFKTHPAPDVRFDMLGDAIGNRFDRLPPGKDLQQRFYRIK
jgi:predicted Zn-dependent protease